MRPSHAPKALLIGANFVASAFIGRAPWVDTSTGLYSRATVIPDGPYSDLVGFGGVLRRAEAQCGCIKKCHRKNWHVDPDNCARCLPCPKNQVADGKSEYKRCVKDDGQQDDDEKKKRRDAKEKRWPAVKKLLEERFKDREPDRKKRRDDRRLKRLGLCTVIAPMGIDWDYMVGVANEFFDEDYLGSGDMLEHWPEDLVIEEWELDEWNDKTEEGFYQSDTFLAQWEAHVNQTRPRPALDTSLGGKRDVRPDDGLSVVERPVRRRGIQKRFLGQLVNLIKGLAGQVGKGGRGKGSSGGGIRSVPMPKFKLGGRGKGKNSTKKQGDKVKDMLDKGPLRWCLERRGPSNHR